MTKFDVCFCHDGATVEVHADRAEWGQADCYLRFYVADEIVAQFSNPLFYKERRPENKA